MHVEEIKPLIGSRIHVDKSTMCEDDAFAQQCLELLEQRGVLVFPRINLTDVEQLAFTDRLGKRISYTGNAPGNDVDEDDVYTVTLDPKINTVPEFVLGTFFWHMDGITSDIAPPRATMIQALSVAPKGGQTEFANTYAAYENLPAEAKAEYDEMRIIHSVYASARDVIDESTSQEFIDLAAHREKEHPLVWTHRSGRKSLLLGSHADRVVGMPTPHGRAIIARLMEWTARPEFTYQHQWEVGDLVVWDNCGALHRVVPYAADSGRTMHRTTIEGVEEVR